jgi:hypothetical protein
VELHVTPERDRALVAVTVRPWPLSCEMVLQRSTSQLDDDIDTIKYPVTSQRYAMHRDSFRLDDSLVGNGTRYYYRARVQSTGGRVLSGAMDSVLIPTRDLGAGTVASLHIDKVHYVLEARGSEGVRKRYPIALGQDPIGRKLCQDRASTPEGQYRVSGIRPKTTFYKALDLDYPKETDQIRYAFCRQAGRLGRAAPDIGGTIQIHGLGIESNWTWGCIAMRSSDIDELFAGNRVQVGTPVTITGRELTPDDLKAIDNCRTRTAVVEIQRRLQSLGCLRGSVDGVLGRATRFGLGRFQQQRGLPITCDPDERTLTALRASN